MSRWIDIDDAIEIVTKIQGMWATTLHALCNAPSIEIITCAECKYKRLYDGETKYYYCALEDRPNRNWSVDDWNYCYWGERKESE